MAFDKCTFIDKTGLQQEVSVDLGHYAEAQRKGLTLRQYINQEMPTADDKFDTFTQLCASAGLNFTGDKSMGLKPTTMADVVFGTAPGGLGFNTAAQALEVSPVQSRVLFPAAILELVESKLQYDRGSATAAFNQMLAMTTTVANSRIEQPVINYTRNDGPESARNTARAQLAEPATMMTIKASEKSLAIPQTPLAVMISDEALQGTTIDMVALALQRQAEVEDYKRAGEDLLDILQGDSDAGSYGTAALTQVNADTFDSTISANGVITHEAYMKWLYNGIQQRQINYIVTDFAGAWAIENRSGRPTNVQNNSMDRLDAPFSIFYPNLVDSVKIFIAPSDYSWPSNTLMGLDSRYAIQKFINSNAAYSDVERFVLRRGSAFVVSFGFKTVRLFDDAFSTVSLTNS